MATSSTRSLRTVGSPPVRRTRRTPSSHEAGDQGGDLLEREDVGPVDVVDAVLGHAVGAAVVAAVGDRHAQVVDHPVLPVDQRRLAGVSAVLSPSLWCVRRSVAGARRVSCETRWASSGKMSRSRRQADGGRASPASGRRRRAPWCRRWRARAWRPGPPPGTRACGTARRSRRWSCRTRPASASTGAVAAGEPGAAGEQDRRRRGPLARDPRQRPHVGGDVGGLVAQDHPRDRPRTRRRCARSRASRPPSSVASVRVSDTVTTATRTRAGDGAWCLCSATLTPASLHQAAPRVLLAAARGTWHNNRRWRSSTPSRMRRWGRR